VTVGAAAILVTVGFSGMAAVLGLVGSSNIMA
jgi:hypothetical protein